MAKAPKGSPLLRARNAAHKAFDPLWKSAHFSREVGYRWLGLKLGVPPKRAHIGKLDFDQCLRAIAFCRAFDPADPLLARSIRESLEADGWRLRKELKGTDRRRRKRARETWRVRAKAKRRIFGQQFDCRGIKS